MVHISNNTSLRNYSHIWRQLIEPSSEERRPELASRIVRHKTYPKWLEDKLTILEKISHLESVLSEIRNNPAQMDDYMAILKIAAFLVSNGHQNLEFILTSQNQPSPDIRIPCDEKQIFIEVKLLLDTSQWATIQDALRAIPSGMSVEIEVDFNLYTQQVTKIIAAATKALKSELDTIQQQIDLGYAKIGFHKMPGIPKTSTAVMISTIDAWKIVGDKDYNGEKDEIRYSDIRRIFESRFSAAVRQLSAVQGCRIVAFDMARTFGDPKLLDDIFIGTPKVQFLQPRGARFYREADGLFFNSNYSSVDSVVTFIGDSPNEALANPKSPQGDCCLSLAGLNRFRTSE